MPIDYNVATMSERCRRENIEDYFFGDKERGVFIIADGAGGCDHGEIASRIAVDTSSKLILSKDISLMGKEDISLLVKEAILAANSSVRGYFISRDYDARIHPEFPCTTLSIVIADEKRIIHGNAGDSRLYLVYADKTPENKPVQPIKKRFMEGKVNYFQMHLKNVTSDHHDFVGRSYMKPDIRVFDIEPEHLGFLLCTDGFYNHLEFDVAVTAVKPKRWGRFSIETDALNSLRDLTSFDLSLRNILGGLEKTEKNGAVSFRYERNPNDVIRIIKNMCRDAARDNVTVVYGLRSFF